MSLRRKTLMAIALAVLCIGGLQHIGSRWLLGSQDPQIDLNIEGLATNHEAPKPGDPEFGLGQLVQPNTVLRIDMHYVNTTDKELLREGWIYLKAVPKEDVVTYVDMLTFFQGAIAIPPNSKGTQTAIARCRVPSDRHIGMVTGHFHQNGTRFSVWRGQAGWGSPLAVTKLPRKKGTLLSHGTVR